MNTQPKALPLLLGIILVLAVSLVSTCLSLDRKDKKIEQLQEVIVNLKMVYGVEPDLYKPE